MCGHILYLIFKSFYLFNMSRSTITMEGRPGSTPELSEEEEWEGDLGSELSGTLNKWTNYIHGWQQRFITVKVGQASRLCSHSIATAGWFPGVLPVCKRN